VIISFTGDFAEKVWSREKVKKLHPEIQRIAHRKLLMLHAAETLDDMKIPPGNRLEKLRGGRTAHHSIRVNDQWRICFRWTPAGPADVELIDYH
jgi:proteic killer suppression protein